MDKIKSKITKNYPKIARSWERVRVQGSRPEVRRERRMRARRKFSAGVTHWRLEG